jgi:hypothetical protein
MFRLGVRTSRNTGVAASPLAWLLLMPFIILFFLIGLLVTAATWVVAGIIVLVLKLTHQLEKK